MVNHMDEKFYGMDTGLMSGFTGISASKMRGSLLGPQIEDCDILGVHFWVLMLMETATWRFLAGCECFSHAKGPRVWATQVYRDYIRSGWGRFIIFSLDNIYICVYIYILYIPQYITCSGLGVLSQVLNSSQFRAYTARTV